MENKSIAGPHMDPKVNMADEFLINLISHYTEGETKLQMDRTREDQIKIITPFGLIEFLATCESIAESLGYNINEYSLTVLQDGGDSLSWTITFTILDIQQNP